MTVKRPENILVITDPQRGTSPAAQRGAELARRMGSVLHLCVFDHNAMVDAAGELVHPEVMRLARQQFIDERMHHVTELAVGLANRGIRVECDVVWAPQLHEAVVAKALEIRADLVIKDVHHDSKLRRLVFGPADWKVVRFAPASVMLVQPGSPLLPRRIGAAVDTGLDLSEEEPLNHRVVEAARELGLYADASVQLAHIFPYELLKDSPNREMRAAHARARQSSKQRFCEFAERHQVPEERRCWLQGETVPKLMELARTENLDLLVIGSVYRSTLDRLFIGSTAEALLSSWPGDLLLVKPENFIAELGRHLDLDAILRRYALGQPRYKETVNA